MRPLTLVVALFPCVVACATAGTGGDGPVLPGVDASQGVAKDGGSPDATRADATVDAASNEVGTDATVSPEAAVDSRSHADSGAHSDATDARSTLADAGLADSSHDAGHDAGVDTGSGQHDAGHDAGGKQCPVITGQCTTAQDAICVAACLTCNKTGICIGSTCNCI